MINKLWAKQYRRYMQSSNEVEFEFSGSPPSSIYQRSSQRLYTVLTNTFVRASQRRYLYLYLFI